MKAKVSQEPSSPETWRTVRDREAADTLADPAKRRYLEPFMRRERTLQQAADALGVAPSTMLYQVRRLLGLGLIEVVRVQPRKGMASKVYRASATRFFVPFERTSAATVEEMLFRLEVATLRTLVQRYVRVRSAHEGGWGLGFALADDGKIEIEVLPRGGEPGDEEAHLLADDAPALLNSYLNLRLRRDDAKAVQRRLAALCRDARAQDDPGEDAYLVHVALVPLAE